MKYSIITIVIIVAALSMATYMVNSSKKDKELAVKHIDHYCYLVIYKGFWNTHNLDCSNFDLERYNRGEKQ